MERNSINFINTITPVLEEMYYLSRNQQFNHAVQEIRLKNRIIPKKNLPNFLISEKLNQEEILSYLSFKNDVGIIASKCRLSESKHIGDFLYSLEFYIVTGDLKSWFDLLTNPYPDLVLKSENGKIWIGFSDFDTDLGQITQAMKWRWDDIKSLMETKAGKKLRSSKDFPEKIKILTLLEKFNPDKVEQKLKLLNYNPNTLADLIRMKVESERRIKDSFR